MLDDDGNNNDGLVGKRNNKKKKKKKMKKKLKQPEDMDIYNRPRAAVDDSIVNGHNNKPSNEDNDDTMCPHKKQRQSSSATTTAKSIFYLTVGFVLGTCMTLPLLFTTCSYISCGGKLKVNTMVDLVLKHKKLKSGATRGGGDGNDLSSFVDTMKYLSSIKDSWDKKEIIVDSVTASSSSKTKGKRRKKNGFDDIISRNSLDDETTIHESMCHVSFIAIANFIHYLPYAQWLVFSNPFVSRMLNDDDSITDVASYKRKDNQRMKKGMFQRVLQRHKTKQHYKEEEESTSSSGGGASEEIDRMHPIRHILEGASIFFHHRKEKRIDQKEKKKKKKQQQQQHLDDDKEIVVDWKKWKYAMSDDYELKSNEIGLIKELAQRVITKGTEDAVCSSSSSSKGLDDSTNISDCSENDKVIPSLSGGSEIMLSSRSFQDRLDAVSWGGLDMESNRWWPPRKDGNKNTVSSHSEGGRLLAAYLKIMKWPTDLHVKYPFKLCKDGCDSEVSLLHTLEWREKYKPWCMSPNAVQFNNAGFVYTQGHSKVGPKQKLEAEKSNDVNTLTNGGHSMVWYRPGLASPSEDPELYGRTMVNTLEMAVSDSLTRNKGTIGRFNVVMDCTGMGSKNSPSIANVKKLFTVLQDHFPDRLGVLLAANLSGMVQMLMKMVLPFVTEDVRAKIHIIPNDEEERREMLMQFMDEDQIPYFLGGGNGYEFNTKKYYEGKCILPEDEILGYLSTMPYHA